MNNYVTLAVAISTCFIGIATSIIAYSQMKIASAKTMLDLYEQRFNIYVAALNCYQVCCKKQPEEILKCQYELIKSCRESQFLFKRDSNIHDILSEMLKDTNKIGEYISYAKENGHLNTIYLRTKENELCKLSDDAKVEYKKKLFDLEEKVKPYIQFENVKGWTFF